jgi:hypothetical protein
VLWHCFRSNEYINQGRSTGEAALKALEKSTGMQGKLVEERSEMAKIKASLGIPIASIDGLNGIFANERRCEKLRTLVKMFPTAKALFVSEFAGILDKNLARSCFVAPST